MRTCQRAARGTRRLDPSAIDSDSRKSVVAPRSFGQSEQKNKRPRSGTKKILKGTSSGTSEDTRFRSPFKPNPS